MAETNYKIGRFSSKIQIAPKVELIAESLSFEQRYNSSYRYSKLGVKIPLSPLEASQSKLRFPDKEESLQHRLKKPATVLYHLVRFLLWDRNRKVLGKLFSVPSELHYETIVATIDVNEQTETQTTLG